MSSVINLVTRAGNEALQVNPTTAQIDIVTPASDFLWAIFSVMAATCIGVMVWGELGVKQGQRVFHYIAFAILATASVAYFCLASDLGSTPIPVEFIRGYKGSAQDPTRSIWYVRYIDWTITTPLLLLELLLVSGLPLSAIFVCIFSDLVMIITGLVGALVQSTYKWGLYTFGCVAMFHVFYILYFPGRKSAYALGDDFGKAYTMGAAVLSFLWFLYPIAWALADGGNVISPTGEMVFYGVLDFLAKPCFAIYHLYALRNMNIDALHLSSGKFTVTENSGAADHTHPAIRRGDEANVGGSAKADRMRDADATLDGHS